MGCRMNRLSHRALIPSACSRCGSRPPKQGYALCERCLDHGIHLYDLQIGGAQNLQKGQRRLKLLAKGGMRKIYKVPPHIIKLTTALMEAAVAQRQAYDNWMVENNRDIGEALAAYDAATRHCLDATQAFMLAEVQWGKRMKQRRVE